MFLGEPAITNAVNCCKMRLQIKVLLIYISKIINNIKFLNFALNFTDNINNYTFNLYFASNK